MISQTPSIGGTSYQFLSEKECGGNSPSFWVEFCKTLPAQNANIYNLPKWWHFGPSIYSVLVKTTAMVVSYGTKLGPVDLISDVNPQ